MVLTCDDDATARAWVAALRALVVTMPKMLHETSAVSPEQLELLRHAFKASDDGQGFVTLQALTSKLLPRLNVSADTELCRRAQLRIFGTVLTDVVSPQHHRVGCAAQLRNCPSGCQDLAQRARRFGRHLKRRSGLGALLDRAQQTLSNLLGMGTELAACKHTTLSFAQVVELYQHLVGSAELDCLFASWADVVDEANMPCFSHLGWLEFCAAELFLPEAKGGCPQLHFDV